MTLIDCSADVHEPIFICHLTRDDVEKIVDSPLPVPLYSVPTQSVERVIQSVKQATDTVVSFQARDGLIRARMESRPALPKFTNKQDIPILFKE